MDISLIIQKLLRWISRLIGLSHEAYIRNILKRFHMEGCKAQNAPMTKGDNFSKKQCPRNKIERQ